jgi:hypothetical protein
LFPSRRRPVKDVLRCERSIWTTADSVNDGESIAVNRIVTAGAVAGLPGTARLRAGKPRIDKAHPRPANLCG